jgi:small GTP-binding protein
MAVFNYSAKEITLKVVYYGPGFSGKTTNLQQLHAILPSDTTGKLISLATEADRTLFFDFLPVDFGKIKDFAIRVQLYTVPGQVKYNATRRLVLKGTDAVVFVADSQRELKEQNMESLKNLKENLVANNLDPDDIPLILQYNKRDLEGIMSEEEINRDLNIHNGPYFQAVASESKGVEKTFKETMSNLLDHMAKKYKIDIERRPTKVPQAELEIITPQLHDPESQKPATFASPYKSQQAIKSMVREETITSVKPERTVPLQTPISPSFSQVVDMIGEIKNVLVGIKATMKDMQRTQEKTLKELSGLRQIFIGAKKKKGLRKFFR